VVSDATADVPGKKARKKAVTI
jgi:hypothetical protein